MASSDGFRNKVRAAKKVGIESQHLHLSASSREVEILELLRNLNEDPTVHGILVQVILFYFLANLFTAAN